MTDEVLESTQASSTELAVVNTALTEFEKVSQGLSELRARYSNLAFDVATTKGMDEAKKARLEIREIRYKVQNAEESAKRQLNDIKSNLKERRELIVAELESIEQPIDAQIKAEEKRKEDERQRRIAEEQARVSAITTRITNISETPARYAASSSEQIAQAIADLQSIEIDESFEELRANALLAQEAAVSKLEELLAAASAREKAEADARAQAEALAQERLQLELERQRLEQERQRVAAEEAQRAKAAAEEAERQRAAKEAEDAARAAELKRQQDAFEEERRQARAEIEARERELRDRQAAAERELEERIAAAEAAEKAAADSQKAFLDSREETAEGPAADHAAPTADEQPAANVIQAEAVGKLVPVEQPQKAVAPSVNEVVGLLCVKYLCPSWDAAQWLLDIDRKQLQAVADGNPSK